MRLSPDEFEKLRQTHEVLSDTGATFTPPIPVRVSRPMGSEHEEQAALFQWARLQEVRWPCLRYMFAIPNGGQRATSTAMRLKAEGVKPGVPDIFLPSRRGGWAGLWLEMKVGSNKPTELQREYLTALAQAGYKTAVCYGADEAIAAIESYMSGDEQ